MEYNSGPTFDKSLEAGSYPPADRDWMNRDYMDWDCRKKVSVGREERAQLVPAPALMGQAGAHGSSQTQRKSLWHKANPGKTGIG